MKKNILLAPGPTPIPETVRQALAEPIIHHRTPQYRAIFAGVSERMKNVFLTKNTVYTFTGSGTSAMEAALVNFHSAGDEILVIEGGKFAERYTDIAKAFGLKPHVMSVTWGEAVDPNKVQEFLKANPAVKSVCVQLCETSTAVLHDIRALGAITSATDTLLIVDGISGLGADRLETDAWNVDLAIAGSQKALMLPPGLAFLSVSEKAKKRLATGNLPRFYLDLRFYEKALKAQDTPFTPAIGLVIGLSKALDLIEAEGIMNVFRRCEELGDYTRDQLKALGLTLFSKAPSATVSAAYIPKEINGEKVISVMRDEKGVTMAGGQGDLKGKIVRIAHMGAIRKADIDEGIRILAETLREMEVKVG
ncbi:MAG: hypothetical protein COW12_10185 [Candidatus Omnitrophica bacterium CG12_big_fil_rev_8_21_14_0_65_45_16]|nr:MAG: hypothetical protein COW12_10185 [Candidatus Omnitrophica bacterium CG12_big_fil_rev_8_21_14_0_65_45_16]